MERLTLFEPRRWGIPEAGVTHLGDELRATWDRFRACFRTKTRDSGEHAWTYLRGLMGMKDKRNYANISRRVKDPLADGQAIQQFMSDSPWRAQAVMEQVQREIAATPDLQTGGVLLLDESADKKAGDKSAGAGLQYNGRLGKVEMSQVGTFLTFYKDDIWTWVDGELFLPQHWFTPEMASERERVGVPEEREFATKVELGWRMIQRVKAHGLPFEAVACDEVYGRSQWLRQELDQAGIVYMAVVPENTQVYLERPAFGVPEHVPHQSGAIAVHPRILSSEAPIEVRQVLSLPDTHFQHIKVRSLERGELKDAFAMRRVWVLREGQPAVEWLVIRHEYGQKYSYALSNAPRQTSLERLAWLKCCRHFVERSIQDSKSEIGWDELQAQKYRAWEHHLALTILASWFIAQTKHNWARSTPQDPVLAQEMELEVLPRLSVANVREMLQAVMPLPELSPPQATQLVVKHLFNRSRSKRSRSRGKRKKSA